MRRREYVAVIDQGAGPWMADLPISELWRLDERARYTWRVGSIPLLAGVIPAALVSLTLGGLFMGLFQHVAASVIMSTPFAVVAGVFGWMKGREWSRRAIWVFWRKDGQLLPVVVEPLIEKAKAEEEQGTPAWRDRILYGILRQEHVRSWRKRKLGRGYQKWAVAASIGSVVLMMVVLGFMALAMSGE